MRHIKKLFGSTTKTKELHSVSMSIDEYLKLNTQRIENTVYLNDIISELSFISGLNPEHIYKVFGKHNFVFNGSEYRTNCWAFKMDEDVFIAVSAKGRGTTIESECTDKKQIVTFLNSFIEKMLSIKDEEIENIHKVLYNFPKKKRRF